ncbi:MAG: hypothetical protein JWP57_4463, partial [Spirosoma sp.]|nr:hypothetical protein [Spirosoma sp.]
AETNELSRFRQIFLQLSHMAVHDTAAVNLIENAILELRNAL